MRLLPLAVLFFLAPAPLCAAALRAAAPAAHVILISIDGLRPDALVSAAAPNLKKLMAEGAYSLAARTTYPSITLTSHTSMMTGVGPRRHKVLWNEYKAEKGPILTTTIFDVAHEAGLSTAMFAGKEKFLQFDKGARLDICEVPGYAMKLVSESASDYLIEKKPALMMVHLAETDGAGHSMGWMSDAYMDAVERADAAVGRLCTAIDEAGLTGRTAILVSADHGGHARTHGTDSDEDMTIPWIAWGAGVRRVGKPLGVKIVTTDTAATILALLGLAIPGDWEGRPVKDALAPPAAAPKKVLAAPAARVR